MTTSPDASLGACPTCEMPVPGHGELFTREFSAGDASITYALCPSCGEVVAPRPRRRA